MFFLNVRIVIYEELGLSVLSRVIILIIIIVQHADSPIFCFITQ